jgi:hypothetical protein
VAIGRVVFAHLSFQVPEKPVLGVWFSATRLGGELAANDDALEVAFFPMAQPPEDLAFIGDRLVIDRLQRELV